jgi:PAS domain S-box-containing protein
MFESSAVGIAVIGRDRRYAAINGAFQRMLGYTAEELHSLGPWDISHEDDRDETQELLDDLMKGRRPDYHVEKRYRRKDGTVIWVRVSTAQALDPHSGLQGIPTIIEDVTERKHAETALHEVRAALVHTSRLTTMGTLSASIAHELNQPLAAIMTNANACARLLDHEPPDLVDCKDAIADIVHDAIRASEVIKRVRGLSKNAAPERAILDVNDAVQEVLALTRHELERHRIAIQTEFDGLLPAILADRIQLQQVILNLIMNGIDAMNEVSDRDRVLRVCSRQSDGDEVAVSVYDSGVGLRPDAAERIFETFFTTKPDGMGLGLAISNSIIEAHGGRLWAAPAATHGTVFSFALPIIHEGTA